MPQKLAIHLPYVNATYRAELFGSITVVTALSYDDPIRQGVISGMLDFNCPDFLDRLVEFC